MSEFVREKLGSRLGFLLLLLFCAGRYGWGWKNFLEEANTGKGLKFPRIARRALLFVPAILIFGIFLLGYYEKFIGFGA